MRVYIAGPYTDRDPDRTAQNIELADELARHVAARGHRPFCPHKMFAGWECDSRFNYEDFIELTREWLLLCNALLLVPGWERSLGTHRELAVAQFHHLPIYTRPEEIPDG